MKLAFFVVELKTQRHMLTETNKKSFVSMHLLEKCFPQCREMSSTITYLKNQSFFQIKEAWAVNRRDIKALAFHEHGAYQFPARSHLSQVQEAGHLSHSAILQRHRLI